MFKLFGKKKAAEKSIDSAALHPEWAELVAQFAPEEMDILAVTDASAYGAGKRKGDQLWRISVSLTAWMEEDSPEIYREKTQLVMRADDQLREYLRQRIPSDFIIKTKARLSLDGKQLLMLALPEPGFDPDLKAILEEQKKPVIRDAEGLGTFTLNRSVNWFQADVDWLGLSIQLTYDQDENQADCCQTALALMSDQENWDRRVREFAAQELLALANDWAEEDEESQPITREQFMARMEPESIQVYEDDRFEFWFGDGDLFFGHSIHVSGSLADGPTDAQMEG